MVRFILWSPHILIAIIIFIGGFGNLAAQLCGVWEVKTAPILLGGCSRYGGAPKEGGGGVG